MSGGEITYLSQSYKLLAVAVSSIAIQDKSIGQLSKCKYYCHIILTTVCFQIDQLAISDQNVPSS